MGGSDGLITATRFQSTVAAQARTMSQLQACCSRIAFAAAFKKLTGDSPGALAPLRAVAAIALQVRQSLWGGHGPNPLDHHGAHANDGDRR